MAKTVLITGCSQGGIGDALAQEFHRQGVKVFASARNLSKVKHLADMGMEVLSLDVLDSKSISAAVDTVKKVTGGKLDYLVNNSGGGYSSSILDMNLDTAKEVYELNVWSVISMIKAFSPMLIAAKGTIVNISSIVAAVGVPFMGAYNSSKAALDSISQALRIELGPLGVETITITTGTVKTNFYGNQVLMDVPETSRYLPVKEQLVKATSAVHNSAIDAQTYSKTVVKQVLKSNKPARVWAGGSATIIWLASSLFPWKWNDSIIVKSGGFDFLSALSQTSASSKF